MTRVLFLAESFHPVLGGGETHVRRLGSALVAAGDAATVVTRRGERSWPAEEVLDGIRVVRVPPSGPARAGKFLMVPAAVRAVLREARRHDLLVVRGTRVLGVPGLLAARAAGLRVVMQPETNGELSGEAWTWGKAW
ncbi:MAG TPA: glycosyltransferase family 4 protein, partial [Vicinamibacteria bacterium]|nr:glycosyltransferase family 4 protein [Vicinamibacteria bacterium]